MRTLIAIAFCVSLSAFAAAPPRGPERLRELVVFPQMSLNFNIGIQLKENQWTTMQNGNVSDEISQLKQQLKSNPDNIHALLKLGYLLDDTNESNFCYQRAIKLCRDRAAVNPEDAFALDDLGEALSGLGRADEAESAYRRATMVSSNDWRCWINQGNFLPTYSFFSMFPDSLRGQLAPGQPPPQAVLNHRPSPTSLQRAEDGLRESSQCFDKAIAIAPREPEIYFQRAGFIMVSNWENCFFSYYRDNQKLGPSDWTKAEFSDEMMADLKRAAELSPGNVDYIGVWASLEWMAESGQINSRNITLNMLPESARQSIDDAIARLENLSEDPNEKIAAAALQYLGFLNFMFGNFQTGASQCRRAVALDPARELCWDILLGHAIKQADFDQAVDLCKARLKYNKSVQNHLSLAKAYTYKREWDPAINQAEIAANLDTNNVVAPLMMAAIDLKRSSDPILMSKAQEEFGHAMELFKRTAPNGDSWRRWREITLNGAIIYGLQGTPESEKAARTWLNEILKFDPNDETARAILEAIPGEGSLNEAQGN